MTPLVTSLLSAVGLTQAPRAVETCLSCGNPVSDAEPRLRLPGGGHVHRGCATYRMRQAERNRRVLR